MNVGFFFDVMYYKTCNLVQVQKGNLMDIVKLNDVMDFSLGKNITRIRDERSCIYTQEDFERDLKANNIEDTKHACILNLIKSKAAPVSQRSEKKIFTQNFMKCSLNTSVILPWYFCYQFNEGKYLDQQISMFHQGTTLSVKKLNIKMVEDLMIPLPDLEKQRSIGEAYRRVIQQYELSIKQAINMKRYALELLRLIVEEV